MPWLSFPSVTNVSRVDFPPPVYRSVFLDALRTSSATLSFHLSDRPSFSPQICHTFSAKFNTSRDSVLTRRCPNRALFFFLSSLFLLFISCKILKSVSLSVNRSVGHTFVLGVHGPFLRTRHFVDLILFFLFSFFLFSFLVACYATLHPALSVRPSVRPSVGP